MTLIHPDKKSSDTADLRRLLGAEKVRDDFATRTAYAVDASIYRIAPHVVVLPETEADIQVVIRFAQRTGSNATGSAGTTSIPRTNALTAWPWRRSNASARPRTEPDEWNTRCRIVSCKLQC